MADGTVAAGRRGDDCVGRRAGDGTHGQEWRRTLAAARQQRHPLHRPSPQACRCRSPWVRHSVIPHAPDEMLITRASGGFPFGPENTLYSYRRSVYECNVRMLEIDVRLSRVSLSVHLSVYWWRHADHGKMRQDKELVLMHDQRLNRTTDGQGMAR